MRALAELQGRGAERGRPERVAEVEVDPVAAGAQASGEGERGCPRPAGSLTVVEYWDGPVSVIVSLEARSVERASESVRPRRCVVTVTASNPAPTAVGAAPIVGAHAPAPEQESDQPRKCDPVAATAISATVEPKTNGELHRSPQSIPAGALVTVPRPVPVLVTTIGKLSSSKTAVTVAAAVSETVQLPLPVQAPVQALNLEPAAGCGLSVTLVFQSKAALQVVPQSIPLERSRRNLYRCR